MKSIIVKNIQIQFDSFDEGADKFTALNTLDNINSLLQEQFPDITPQIFVNAIDDDDIEIADQSDNEDEEDKPTYQCPNCRWEGTEDELATTTDLSEGTDIEFGKCCPVCRHEDLNEY